MPQKRGATGLSRIKKDHMSSINYLSSDLWPDFG